MECHHETGFIPGTGSFRATQKPCSIYAAAETAEKNKVARTKVDKALDSDLETALGLADAACEVCKVSANLQEAIDLLERISEELGGYGVVLSSELAKEVNAFLGTEYEV